jgi:hypothetical protein
MFLSGHNGLVMKVKGRGQPADATPDHHAVELLARIDYIGGEFVKSPVSDSMADAQNLFGVSIRIPVIALARIAAPITLLGGEELSRGQRT